MTPANLAIAFQATPPRLRTITATDTDVQNAFITLHFNPTTCMYSHGNQADNVYVPPFPASRLWIDLEDMRLITKPPFNSNGRNPDITTAGETARFYGFSSAFPGPVVNTAPDVGARSIMPKKDVSVLTDNTNSIIDFLFGSTLGSHYRCVMPYITPGDGYFCELKTDITLTVTGYEIPCTLIGNAGGNEPVYQCMTRNAASQLRARCHISVTTMGDWYAETEANRLKPSPRDWVNTTSRFVASSCMSGSVAGDYFDCRYPLVAAPYDAAIGFCDYSHDYSEIYVACNGKCIHCISQHGPHSATGGTQCRPVGAEIELLDDPYSSFWSGDLYLNCLFMRKSSALVELYRQRSLLGNQAIFTCYDAYMQNSTIQLDTNTGAWVEAGAPMGDMLNLPARRLLLHAGGKGAGQEANQTTSTESERPPVFIGRDYQYLNRAKPFGRVPMPTHRMRTSDRVTWMEGVHVLHPNYERVNWIPLPSDSTLTFIQDTDTTAPSLGAATAVSSVNKYPWFRPRPVYRSLIHSTQPLPSSQGSLTLGETLQSAYLLKHLTSESHPLFSQLARKHSPALANRAMVQHFKRHQTKMSEHRRHRHTGNCTHQRSTHHRSFMVRDGMSGDVLATPQGRRRAAAADIGTVTEERTFGNVTRTITTLNLPSDPLAFHYTPVCTDLLQQCDHSQLHCTHYDRYYVEGRRNRNTFCMNNLINSCHTPNQTRPSVYTLSCPSGPFTDPHIITCNYDHTDPHQCLYTCQIATRHLTMRAYPVAASILLDASLDSTLLNGKLYNRRCDYVMHTATSTELSLQGYTNNYFWCVAPMTPIFAYPTNRTLDTRHHEICYNQDAGTRNYTLVCGMLTLACRHQVGSPIHAPLYTCTAQKSFIPGMSDKITATWTTRDLPVEWLIAGSQYNIGKGITTSDKQCVAIRERTRGLAITAPTQHQYTCAKHAGAEYIRLYDDINLVCSVVFDATTSMPAGGLTVPLIMCPQSGILINCTFHTFIAPGIDVYTGRFVCQTDLDARSTRNLMLIANHQFAMACTTIDPLMLQSYGIYTRTDGMARAISTTDTRLAIESQDACMYVKRSCDTPGLDYFGCNTIFAQDSSRNEFCDVGPAKVPIELPVFTCGTMPRHAIFCSNHDTARNGWLRCQNAISPSWTRPVNVTIDRLQHMTKSQEHMKLDCSISIGVMEAVQSVWLTHHPEYASTPDADWLDKPDVCNQMRLLCSFHVTTAAVVPVLEQINAALGSLVFDTSTDTGVINQEAAVTIGNAGTHLSRDELLFDPNDNPTPRNNTLACYLPALMCTDVFCQVSNVTMAFNDTSSSNSFFSADRPYMGMTNPDGSGGGGGNATQTPHCRPHVPLYKMMCQGVPISCTLHTVVVNGIGDSSYRCTSTHTTLNELHANADAAGMARPYVSQSGLGCGIDIATFQQVESPTTLCRSIGAQCVRQNGVSCISGFATNQESPFCTLRASDNPGSPMFECSDLAVSCEWDAINNWMFCTSQPGSDVWSLGSRFASPRRADGRTGCVIASSASTTAATSNVVRFYENVEKRCETLDSLCRATCAPGYRTFYESDGRVRFCEPDKYNYAMQQTFTCDKQDITCSYTSPNRTRSVSIAHATNTSQASSSSSSTSPSSSSSSIYVDNTPNLRILYESDPDYGRNHRVWQCQNQTAARSRYPDSLMLDCSVSGSMLQYASDSCSAILGGCRTNGTLSCLGNYRATKQQPFCTIELVDLPPSTECDCGVWWSNGVTLAPRALEKMMTPGGEEAACASRGYLSTGRYLQMCINDPAATPEARASCRAMMTSIFGGGNGAGATTPWKQSWCLWNYAMPTAMCATAPGKRLPLCTIECPEHLHKKTLDGGKTEYCCMHESTCTVAADARNCVLGKHADVWYDESQPLWSIVTSADLLVDPTRVPQMRSRSFYPDRNCPRNMLSTYTAYPVVTSVSTGSGAGGAGGGGTTTSGADLFRSRIQTMSPNWFNAAYTTTPPSLSATPVVTVTPEALQYSQARAMCRKDPECWGFVVVHRGLYFLSRAPALPERELRAMDPRRAIQFDDESVFHMHRVRKSEEGRRATTMVAATNFEAYFIERTYGYACPSTAFDWRDYLNTWPEALERVEQRMMQHFLDAGVSLGFYNITRYSVTRNSLFNMTMVTRGGQMCANTTSGQYDECALTDAFDAEGLTAYERGNVKLLLDSNRVSVPTLAQHRYKRIFFVNLIVEDMRDGVALDEYSTKVANQTIREFVDNTLFPVEHQEYRTITSDLVSATCVNTYNQSTTPMYTGLHTQKSHAFTRRIPIWGKSDGTIHAKVYVYDAVNPITNLFGNLASRNNETDAPRADGDPPVESLFHDHDTSVSPYVLIDDTAADNIDTTQLAGFIDLPDNQVFFVEFSSFGSLYGFYAWRDWMLHGHMTRGEARLSPNAQCRLNTPLWYDFPYVRADQMRDPRVQSTLHVQPLCVVPRCPMPISRQYIWPSGTVRNPILYPDPSDATVAKDWDSIPCAGHGSCVSRRLDEPQAGTCRCDTGSFFTVDSMDHPTYDASIRAYHTPRSLQNPSCSIDTREGCFDAESNTGGSCANNGMCVTKFEGQTQKVGCKCGRFPDACHLTEPRRCERDLLKWETNGFDEMYACNAPRQGCRNSTTWSRPPGAYLRTASYGCEMVRTGAAMASTTGKCVRDGGDSNDVWHCKCKDGYYGTHCQYVSLEGGCFNSSTPVYKEMARTIDLKDTCYFNDEIGQFQLWSWYDTQAANLVAPTQRFNASCRGVICSGRGTCAHEAMNNYGRNVYDNTNPLQERNNLALLGGSTEVSSYKMEFQNALRERLRNQRCTCKPGYSGKTCELRECPTPCQNGARCVGMETDTPRCECPRHKLYSNIYLTSDRVSCGGVVCDGRGKLDLTVQSNGEYIWNCLCADGYKWETAKPQTACSGTTMRVPDWPSKPAVKPSVSSSTGQAGGGGGGMASTGRAGGSTGQVHPGVIIIDSSSSTGHNTTTGSTGSSDTGGPFDDSMDPTEDMYLGETDAFYDEVVPIVLTIVSTLVTIATQLYPLLTRLH